MPRSDFGSMRGSPAFGSASAPNRFARCRRNRTRLQKRRHNRRAGRPRSRGDLLAFVFRNAGGPPAFADASAPNLDQRNAAQLETERHSRRAGRPRSQGSMLWFVAALIVGTASGIACCGVLALRGARPWACVAATVGLSALLAVAIFLRGWVVPPRHAMYLDEPWYAEAACNASRSARLELCEATWQGRHCTAYEKGIGWPLLLVPAAVWADCHPDIGIVVNQILAALTVALVMLATRLVGGRWWQGLFAAALLVAHPVHVQWSVTGESNVSAAAALLAGVCGALLSLRQGSSAAAVLAVSGFGLASAIRPENAVAAFAAAAVLARFGAGHGRRIAFAIAVVAAAAAATALPLWSMNQEISGGAFLSPLNWLPNLRSVFAEAGLVVQAPLAVLAIVGAAQLARRDARVAWLLIAVGIAAELVVLAYDRFHPRMLLAATAVLLPMTGLSCEILMPRIARISRMGPDPIRAIRAIRGHPGADGPPRWRSFAALIVGVLVLGGVLWSWRPALDATRYFSETQYLETEVATGVAEHDLPDDALVIAVHPTVLAAGGLPVVMSTKEALRDPAALRAAVASGRPVFFLSDMFCEPDYAGGAAADCRQILTQFGAKADFFVSYNVRSYSLFRLRLD
jgi:hypothetical protein